MDKMFQSQSQAHSAQPPFVQPQSAFEQELLAEYQQVHMNVFGTPARVLDHGEGVHVWDVDGNQYLDFLGGIAVNSVGYAHPKWVAAVAHQAGKLAHTSNYFATVPQIRLAARLLQLANAPQGSRVYFANSGTEGNEAALKLAKLHGHAMLGKSARASGNSKPVRILALTHGFHGRTLGALSATWKPAIREPFEPLLPNIEFVEAGNIESLREAFQSTGSGESGKGPVAAIIMEMIQGEAGVLPVGPAFVQEARRLCDTFGALLIVDEVQCGVGRTGTWFSFQREDLSGGVVPDAISFAKGIAGGFPMGGLITFGTAVSALFTPGSHGSTFAGNPLAAAAGLATLDIIEQEHLLENAQVRGEQLREGIMASGNPLYRSTRGRGLLDAAELAHPCAHAVAAWCLDHGLIVNAVAPHALRFAPSLTVSEDDVEQAIAILAQVPYDCPDD